MNGFFRFYSLLLSDVFAVGLLCLDILWPAIILAEPWDKCAVLLPEAPLFPFKHRATLLTLFFMIYTYVYKYCSSEFIKLPTHKENLTILPPEKLEHEGLVCNDKLRPLKPHGCNTLGLWFVLTTSHYVLAKWKRKCFQTLKCSTVLKYYLINNADLSYGQHLVSAQ